MQNVYIKVAGFYKTADLPKATLLLLFALLSCAFISCVWAMESYTAPSSDSLQFIGKCNRVVDGDSLYLEGLDTQIRLWGVDAPERDEKGYSAAKNNLNRLAYGKPLRCVQQDIDKYNRIVARCFVKQNNSELNREQIRAGVAKEYCYFSKNHYGYCKR